MKLGEELGGIIGGVKMKIQNKHNGKIRIKETKKDNSQYVKNPQSRDYLLLDKMSDVENYFFDMRNKYKFSTSLKESLKDRIANNALDEIRNYQTKTEEGNMTKAEYFYFNLQKEKAIINDLKKCKFDECNHLVSCQFNDKINQLENSIIY